ncbi:sugar transferase [Natronomonas salina]|uniref:sugar transferase n=1 Tax=Natronomonas salina TaxID=1710540 RepID=UPI0015B71465|nr:sugar transferase [Natronomonas salina]QLD90790.1 sugar transferase [Natronomonas salina]
MRTGWPYRVGSIVGVAGLSMLAVVVANQPVMQSVFTTYVPVFWRLDPVTLSYGPLTTVLWVAATVFVVCFLPLYKPRPRRVLDTVTLADKRTVVAGCILATLGYFNWSHRLPRSTLVITCGILFVVLPTWFVLIRRRPNGENSRVIIIGDDTEAMEAVLAAAESPVIGYVSPLSHSTISSDEYSQAYVTDGGSVMEELVDEADARPRLRELDRLGGLSRLDEALVEYDVDTAFLAFSRADRAEFFGTLDACYEHGVTVKVHREHADSVLTNGFGSGELVDVDLEPWDTVDHLLKRTFDVVFSIFGLIATVPVMLVIALAIKLDDGGPVLYQQARTAAFGDMFSVYKFRSMVEDAESISGAKISDEDNGNFDPRVTRIGRFLRRTHFDEIPQLWSILIGDMSVVGPRPERPELETNMESDAVAWRRRWFVKPGLTGLAQINGVTGFQPKEKLRLDIEYIRRQSLWFDLKIIAQQFWEVLPSGPNIQ